jgi:RNA polymerase sigma factor (sigma-70 family)
MLSVYLKQIRHIPRLTLEEEICLSRRVLQGDFTARDILVRSNLKLVIDRAKAFCSGPAGKIRGTYFDDLISEGNLGLIRAAETYDYDRHRTRFSTHAGDWIQQSFTLVIRRGGFAARIKNHDYRLLQKYRRAKFLLKEQNGGRSPCFAEVVDHLKLEPSRERHLRAVIQLDDSESSLLKTGDEGWSLDELVSHRTLRPDQKLENQEEFDIIKSRMYKLTKDEKFVLDAMIGLDDRDQIPTLRELGPEINKSHSTVNNLYRRALNKLRQP